MANECVPIHFVAKPASCPSFFVLFARKTPPVVLGISDPIFKMFLWSDDSDTSPLCTDRRSLVKLSPFEDVDL